MKTTLNWLKQYVEYRGTTAELADQLTLLGLEVENVRPVPGEFEGIVVAEVLTRGPVHGSDKLSLCKVQDGTAERQIVCGASNFKPGDKVALILPGSALPLRPGDKEPFVIRERKVFGFVSQGMMCSPEELGLPDAVDGILILRPDARPGQSFAEYLGRPQGDVVFDLEITPNRPDLNSTIGIAREIAALTGQPLRLPPLDPPQATTGAALVRVRVEDPDLCPRYIARVLRGLQVGPSPDWLRSLLEKLGLRSINNVVDATNFVMLETGQPLHAFDYHLVSPGPDGVPSVVVRRASAQEPFTTLDGQARALHSEMLLIADESKGIALAGVMGGQNTEINPQTTDVILESAVFHPANIRRTSRTLGLRTDASYRFERGVDPALADWASSRCVQLLLQMAGGHAAGAAVESYPNPATPHEIILRHTRTNSLLGLEIPDDLQVDYLRRLGLEVVSGAGIAPTTGVRTPRSSTFVVPSHRPDLEREIDLIEEICRLHGVDQIPASSPRGAIGLHPHDALHDVLGEARRILAGLGLDEAQGQTLIREAAARHVAPPESIVRLANPLSADMNALRPSLLPGLLDCLQANARQKTTDVALFELGRVFLQRDGKVVEQRRIAITLTGRRSRQDWTAAAAGADVDLLDLKGIVEEFLERFGIRAVVCLRHDPPPELFLESAQVSLGGKAPLGQLGRLHPAIGKHYDLRMPAFLAELDLDELLARRNPARSFKPLPQFPSIRRDVAMVVRETVTHQQVLDAVRQFKAPLLESTDLFDVFRGPGIAEGLKSLAYAFIYRHTERTLTDAEVNVSHEKLVAHLQAKLDATLR